MTLRAKGVTLARGARTVLAGVDAGFAPGTVTVLAGSNGAGKSTLLAALAGELRPAAGAVLLDGAPLADLPAAQRARRRAWLPQRCEVAFDFTVAEVAAMGLHPHGLSGAHGGGAALVAQALADLDLEDFADRPVTRLSGGEQQRAHLARTLAQARGAAASPGTRLLLLDEPTAGLDYRRQFALAALLRAEAAAGACVVASLHDLALAARLADRVLLIADGRVAADGPTPAVLRPEPLAAAFGLKMADARHLLEGSPMPAPGCLTPGVDGASSTHERKEALWARFYTGAPGRQRLSV